jgi:hypothetical protein
MKPRPARGAISQVGSAANRSTSNVMSRMTSIFSPVSAAIYKLADGASGSATGRRQTEMGDLRLKNLRGLGTKGR